MSASTGEVPGRIFMTYRREDTAYPAAWLFDRLAGHFGRDQVFKDIDSIELGDDFVEVITAAVGSCDALLALIGDRWLSSTDRDGQRRLDDPGDFVRLEIEAALARDVRVIPILVGGAQMPRVDGLIANGKFCCVRRVRLSLTWWHRPLRLRGSALHTDVGLVGEPDDPDMDRLPSVQPAPGRRAPVGSGLSAAGALGRGGQPASPGADHRGGA